ncbi:MULTISPECIES: TRAP transporter TatT component family protein [unclassified Leptospira]|uniref:TRAP transporter TatT component family protein n=1 Tax=unclassified Leptospira TaxID=2633828 RepID=UPI0002C03C61|nr:MULTISPECIES: TRAP transporter TatT component family protein [unclassified Leptospira]EMJ97472.1 putative lipoprotein [Leptospira sp. B5-022]MCR1794825.1 TRAP transporter TatT component family protein [Leptospira sp. id769339]
MYTIRVLIGAIAIFSTVLSVGCATTRTAAWDNQYSAREIKPTKIPADLEKLWKSRHVKEDLQKFIEKTEAWASENPSNYESKVLLCRAYYLLADGHLYVEMNDENEASIKKQQNEYFDKGIKWCERGLAHNQAFYEKVIKGGAKFEDSLDTITLADIDALYWRYANLAKWSRLEGLMTLLENKSKLTKTMLRVEQLNKTYFYGAVLRYKAGAEALSPTGNKKLADQYFEECIKVAPDYFGTRVLYADFRLRGNEEAAIKQLNYVIKGNAKAIPDVESENIIEQLKAKKLIKEFE